MKTYIRMNILREMDTYIRKVIGDDKITYDKWCSTGLPDDWDEYDLISIAEDDELFYDCVATFERCLEVGEMNGNH